MHQGLVLQTSEACWSVAEKKVSGKWMIAGSQAKINKKKTKRHLQYQNDLRTQKKVKVEIMNQINIAEK